MQPLHFQSVVTLGVAIAALLTLACLLLIPALASNRATRYLSVGNLCFTLMLVARLMVGDPPSAFDYATVWSMLVVSAAMHQYAIEDLGTRRRAAGAWRHVGLAVALGSIWAALSSSSGQQLAAIATGAAVLVFQALAMRASLRLDGSHLKIARRTLAGSFCAGAAFAGLHLLQRIADVGAGHTAVSPTAGTYFGAILLFCSVNVGFLLLMYLQLAERVHRLAQTDELTGALNRRGFAHRLEALGAQRRGGRTGALLLIDIDRFKSVNDQHGHAVGDEVLRWFASTIRRFMRHDDLLTRMGGEEFCLLLPGLSDVQAMQIAERIRVEFERHCTAPTSKGPLRVTASFGLAPFDPVDGELDARLRQADEALYAAKRGGRNRVVRWEPGIAQIAPT